MHSQSGAGFLSGNFSQIVGLFQGFIVITLLQTTEWNKPITIMLIFDNVTNRFWISSGTSTPGKTNPKFKPEQVRTLTGSSSSDTESARRDRTRDFSRELRPDLLFFQSVWSTSERVPCGVVGGSLRRWTNATPPSIRTAPPQGGAVLKGRILLTPEKIKIKIKGGMRSST